MEPPLAGLLIATCLPSTTPTMLWKFHLLEKRSLFALHSAGVTGDVITSDSVTMASHTYFTSREMVFGAIQNPNNLSS